MRIVWIVYKKVKYNLLIAEYRTQQSAKAEDAWEPAAILSSLLSWYTSSYVFRNVQVIVVQYV
jgi:hypothetical protein